MHTPPSSTHAALVEGARQYITGNYRPHPVVLERGEGCWVWDVDGRRYLDMTSGIAVSALGHAHPRLVRAIAEQAGRLIHGSNLFLSAPFTRFVRELVERSFAAKTAGRVFVCNSGAEANEAAFKLVRRWQQKRGASERIEIVACEASFHGRTSAAISMTGQAKYREGFGPLVGPVTFVPFGDAEAAKRAIGERTCAMIVEPIQGEGGVATAPPPYFQAIREACDRAGALLILDEVQTGFGRTGSMWAYESLGITPDVMTLAKGIAGGVPMGAMVATGEAATAFEPGTHATTFGGNPLACAAALAVLETLDAEGLVENARAVGEHLGRGLASLVKKHPSRAVEARGTGLLRGLKLTEEAAPYARRCIDEGLLVSVAGGTVLRFTPALNVDRATVDQAIEILDRVLA
ncbi:MAG TPA: aspartate aminotransferase family protein [Polyangiaceae bacterium]